MIITLNVSSVVRYYLLVSVKMKNITVLVVILKIQSKRSVWSVDKMKCDTCGWIISKKQYNGDGECFYCFEGLMEE